MTFFVFRRAKSHEWTFCDLIKYEEKKRFHMGHGLELDKVQPSGPPGFRENAFCPGVGRGDRSPSHGYF
jgi:hypothetical protein